MPTGTTISTVSLRNTPDSNALWRGLGGNFDSLTQIINEFVDNSLSDFIKFDQSESKEIIIKVIEKEVDVYQIQIEDTGSGIKDLAAAFSIGNKSVQSSSLNEHGFGMKHALAAANPENNNWSVKTRTEENKINDEFYEIKAPFELFGQEALHIVGSTNWEGRQPTGTIITFNISKHLLRTLSRGLRGNYQNLESLMEILAEDLGYTYGEFISESVANISIRYKSLSMKDMVKKGVPKIKPASTGSMRPGEDSTSLDLGNGEVEIEYEFLQADRSNNKKYYLANMSTSGVEIRVNNRLLADNLFSEIWGVEKHNSYNYILIRLNIKSDLDDRLPSTTTTKSGLKQDDPKLEKIYDWIRSKFPEPKKRVSLSDDEVDLFDQLKELKEKQLLEHDPSLIVEREKKAFTSMGEKVRVDLYQSYMNKIHIYEGKTVTTTPKDVYQLLMYWDGLVMDEVPVDKGILIAASHPESVRAIVNLKNETKDQRGKKYVIELRTWQDEGINYP